VTTYNFYEFGTDKGDPAAHAASLKTRPGRCSGRALRRAKTLTSRVARFLEERVYRLRCVEVVHGHSWDRLSSPRCSAGRPTAQAKFVEFTTLVNPEMFPG
jgi:sulfoxide reductase catalytic subunit YedY